MSEAEKIVFHRGAAITRPAAQFADVLVNAPKTGALMLVASLLLAGRAGTVMDELAAALLGVEDSR